ncbi:hypothetical protein KBB96_09925 [Luteolibacter ambystomatis]|uniref:Transposase n=1 Tax=Luteolibacter ambystomatis TaxID=2824561 RepID=A0A975PGY0_9BACT|nr:hypothetical protein [Luteolibacter ambystomatis]QUE52986.1 hypothetical protein KBB96_08855 [Luteolibacter ambystomatis]QUE53198.1 hypothetical protein KBB96_09925 [Luteolibacter ambystomatis]
MKQDCIGRIRFSREQRDALLDAYQSSGSSGPQFCALHGVKYQTFATWLQKRKRDDGRYPVSGPAPAAPLFLPAVVEKFPTGIPPVGSVGLEVRLPGGATLLIRDETDVSLAARVIQRLSGGAAC